MKKIISVALLLVWGMMASGQQVPDRSSQIQKERYLKKSRTQKTVAWILTGVGAVCVITPLVDGSSPGDTEGDWFNFSGLQKTLDTYAYVTGAVLIGSGVGLFIAAHNNKQKAAAISFIMKPEKLEYYTQSGGYHKLYPAAGIRIQIK